MEKNDDFRGVIPRDLASGALWPQIAALVSRAMAFGRGEYLLEDVRAGIDRGELFAIGVVREAEVEFVMICTLVQFPRKQVLYVVYGAGRGAARMRAPLQEAARILQVDWIETRCRESIARYYRRHGFDIGYSVCIQETSK